jgi:hypothetical protein
MDGGRGKEDKKRRETRDLNETEVSLMKSKLVS